jgi:hypothetical protein
MTLAGTPPDPVRSAAESIGLDLEGLHALMACAGPTLAPELRRSLLSDLAAAHAGLRLAGTCAAAERHAHVLLALAGQAGATALTLKVKNALNAARQGDTAGLATLLPSVLIGTEALITVVIEMPLPGGAG